jgi:hypothetical protein
MHKRIVSISLLLALLLGITPAVGVHAAGTVSTCTEAGLDDALSGGGTVTFACSGTITLTSAKTISSDTTIDGFGQNVILDGGDSVQLFQVNEGISLTLKNLTLQNGDGGGSGDGGAVDMNNGGTLAVQNCTFRDNSGDDGGAINADDEGSTAITVTIENSLFDGNFADDGGAIFIDGDTAEPALLEISNSTFWSNVADPNGDESDGGAIHAASHTTINIEGTTFAYNYAGDDAGAIYAYETTNMVNIANCTFSGNTAGIAPPPMADGGAMLLRDANVVQSTFYNNQTRGGEEGNARGDAIYWRTATGASVVLRDNVFYSNSGDAAYTCESSGGSGAYGNDNLSDDGSCNTGGTGSAATNFDTTLQDNGGPTDTHALNALSNAIDTASACTYVSTVTNTLFSDGDNITRDQRGALRPYNGGTCDKGAVEYHAPQMQCNLVTDVDILLNDVTFNFSQLGALSCITVTRMYTDHLMATGPGAGGGTLHTGDWWHITGDGAGFTVSITLPYAGANASSRVCKYPGGLGGYGWDCDDGSNTTFGADRVTRSGITSFSDWSVGGGAGGVGPTAITARDATALPATGGLVAATVALGLGLGGLAFARRRSKRKA